MLLNILKNNQIKTVSMTVSGRSKLYEAIIVEVRRDTSNLNADGGTTFLREEASKKATDSFLLFYDNNFMFRRYIENNGLIEGFEESKDGERVKLERFHFEKFDEDVCEEIVFQKVYFFDKTVVDNLTPEQATEIFEGAPPEDTPREQQPLKSRKFIELCDVDKSVKKASFIEKFLKTPPFSFYMQRPKKNLVVRGINFRKFARKRKLSKLVKEVRRISKQDVYRDGILITRRKSKRENIKVSFGPNPNLGDDINGDSLSTLYDCVTKIELITARGPPDQIGEKRIIFSQKESDLKQNKYPVFNNRKANFYFSELDGLFNKTLATALVGDTSFVRIAELFLAPGVAIEKNSCAYEAGRGQFGEFRPVGNILEDVFAENLIDSLDTSKELQEISELYKTSGKTKKEVDKETALIKNPTYISVVGESLGKIYTQGKRNVGKEFKEFMQNVNPINAIEEVVDETTSYAKKLEWNQLITMGVVFGIQKAAASAGVDPSQLLSEEYIRKQTVKLIARRFKDNQVLSAFLLTVPEDKLQEIASKVAAARKDEPPQVPKGTPSKGLQQDDQIAFMQDSQWLSLEELKENRQTNIRERSAAEQEAINTIAENSEATGINLSREELGNKSRRQLSKLVEKTELILAIIAHDPDHVIGSLSTESNREIRQLLRRLTSDEADQRLSEARERAAALEGPGQDLEERMPSPPSPPTENIPQLIYENRASLGLREGITLEDVQAFSPDRQQRLAELVSGERERWFVAGGEGGDEFAMADRYFKNAVGRVTSEETRRSLVEFIIYAFNCEVKEGDSDKLERIIELIVFDIGADSTVVGDLLDYFGRWSQFLNIWDIDNLEICQIPDFALPGGFPSLGNPFDFDFPPKFNLPKFSLADILAFLLKQILDLIFTAIFYILQKIINFILSLIPDIVFDFDICNIGQYLSDFGDAFKNSFCSALAGENVAPDSLGCYNFGEIVGAEAGAAAQTTFQNAAERRGMGAAAMDLSKAWCAGLLPPSDLMELLNGEVTEIAKERTEAYLTDTNPDLLAQIQANPEVLADIGQAIGHIIGIDEIEASLAHFEPVMGSIDDLCEDPEIEKIFEQYCISQDPGLIAELKEILDNQRRILGDDIDKAFDLLTNPNSIVNEINDAIGNMMHPSINIPPLFKSGDTELGYENLTLVKDIPKFVVGRDDGVIGEVNMQLLETNTALLESPISAMASDLSGNRRQFARYIEDEARGEITRPVWQFTPNDVKKERIDAKRADVGVQIARSFAQARRYFKIDRVKENVYLPLNQLIDVGKAEHMIPSDLPNRYSVEVFFRNVVGDNPQTNIQMFDAAETFINNAIEENYNPEYGVVQPNYNDLLQNTLDKTQAHLQLDGGERTIENVVEQFDTFSNSLASSLNPQERNPKYDINPYLRLDKIQANYKTGEFKQENTYKRFVDTRVEYSKLLLSFTDAELVVLEEVISNFIQAVILEDLPSLLVYSRDQSSGERDLRIPSPFVVNDLTANMYGGAFNATIKKKINQKITKKFTVTVSNKQFSMKADAFLSYLLFEIGKIKKSDFGLTYGRRLLPTDMFNLTINKVLLNITQTLYNYNLDANQLEYSQHLSTCMNELIFPFEYPSAINNDVRSTSSDFDRLSRNLGRYGGALLTSTCYFNIELRESSDLPLISDTLLPMLSVFLEGPQQDIVLNMLEGRDSVKLSPFDTFHNITSGEKSLMAQLHELAIAAADASELPIETFGPLDDFYEFLFFNFEIKIGYDIYASSMVSTDTRPEYADDMTSSMFSTSGHTFLQPYPSADDRLISMTRLVSFQSEYILEKNGIGSLKYEQIYPDLHKNFLNYFMSINSEETPIKSEGARNVDLITFFQLAFPLGDIINTTTIYFSERIKEKDPENPLFKPNWSSALMTLILGTYLNAINT